MLQNKITETCFLLQLLHNLLLQFFSPEKKRKFLLSFFYHISYIESGKARAKRKKKYFVGKKEKIKELKLISRIKSLYIIGIGFFGFN